ncbi:indolepyruvate oxidoreductase [Geothrix limicola]|uniref:Indolepyruvate oxidoreductase n=1 Tax=Geothrix limicola TaxID=2927978 RepID=A0ABQ5QHZ5_9BACT|nr:indolepyruvate oxidoreductase subunit beta [Geothrix limicola]GLH73664.1 indolepyruvate oxidoreductase [Geothrix limicola]
MSAPRIHGIVLSGVGGQGVLSLAQIVLEALRRSGLHALQSEIHGMSQRGGSVHAQVCFSEGPLTSPIIDEGSADLLIALEPLEALRYVSMLRMNGHLVVSEEPQINMEGYPPIDDVYAALKAVRGAHLLDTEDLARRLSHKQAGGMALLGMASRFLPVSPEVWQDVITQRFEAKGARVTEKNLEAFQAGRGLIQETVGA